MPASALLWHRGCAAARAQTLVLVTAMAMTIPTKAGACFCTLPRTCSSCLPVPPSAPAAALRMSLLTDTYDNIAMAPSSAKAPADHPSFSKNINKNINKNTKQQQNNIQIPTSAANPLLSALPLRPYLDGAAAHVRTSLVHQKWFGDSEWAATHVEGSRHQQQRQGQQPRTCPRQASAADGECRVGRGSKPLR